MTSDRHVAVWIDHDEARIFHVEAETFEEKTLHAPTRHVHRHAKGVLGEHDHPDDEHRFFTAVAQQLATAERVLVVGPSTAKLEFIRYAHKHDPKLEPRIIGIETVDHPTDRQLVAYAKHYFAADDGMQGRPRIPTRQPA
jgi:stalled ribosome rescue protein Dom34